MALLAEIKTDDGKVLSTVALPIKEFKTGSRGYYANTKIEIDGKRYDLELRFRREYLPFSMTLIEFRFDRYLGTEVAKNYSSRVRLVDPERGEDREVLIKMNDPLRYAGETFYQADFDKDTERGTELQVVRNPGWLIPYISCVLVTLGMAVHFGLSLTNFLRRRAES